MARSTPSMEALPPQESWIPCLVRRCSARSPLLELQLLVNDWLRVRGLDDMQVVFLTAPYLPALYMEDLLDAAEHVGLQLLTLPWYIFRSGDSAQWPVSHINSAMAGMGLGLDGVFDFEDSGCGVEAGEGVRRRGRGRETLVGESVLGVVYGEGVDGSCRSFYLGTALLCREWGCEFQSRTGFSQTRAE